MGQKGATRAVVIGISDYENAQISDLRFADADARAFADYLHSPAGGNVAPENVMLLTNASAKLGQIVSAITWLVEESQPGDQAILYFAGHGDMEALTGLSFLLAYNASATAYSGGGAFPVVSLQAIITRLSTQKQVQVLLITDACRSGKLAGNEIGGQFATSKILSDQFANELKVLSCQPNEFSLEGTEWGGGRGVFSYYLLDALRGLADKNQDQSVSLLELGQYLENSVPVATAPHSQIPMIVGNRSASIAKVDAATLADLRSKKSSAAAPQGLVASRVALGNLNDTTAERLFGLYENAVASGHLLLPQQGSAYQLYQQLKERPSMQPSIGLMRRNLAAAFQDEAQTAINDYLAADPRELRKRWGYDDRYQKFPAYLEKSAELLGESHFMYRQLKAREHYFSGLNTRLQGERTGQSALFLAAKREQELALQMDSTAAYAYNEMGVLARRLGDVAGSVGYFKKALALSPAWVLALANLCVSYVDLEQYADAEKTGLRAISLDAANPMAHYNLGLTYQQLGDFARAISHYEKTIQYDPEYAVAYFNLGLCRYRTGEYAKAAEIFGKYTQHKPEDSDGFNNLGNALMRAGKSTEAEKNFEKAIALDPHSGIAFESLGELYRDKKNWEKAEQYFAKSSVLQPEKAAVFYQLARVQSMQGQSQKAFSNLQLAFEKGFQDAEQVKKDALLSSLRAQPAFEKVMERYFGGK